MSHVHFGESIPGRKKSRFRSINGNINGKWWEVRSGRDRMEATRPGNDRRQVARVA